MPYFIVSLIALVAILGVLVFSGAIQLQAWKVLKGYGVVGDFDNVPGKTTSKSCFEDCSKAYVACVFTDGLPEGYNCQLYRSVACGYPNKSSTTKYDPNNVVNQPDLQICTGSK